MTAAAPDRPEPGGVHGAAVAVWRRRRAVLAAALAVAVLVGVVSLFLPARYRATATHQIAVTGPAGVGDMAEATTWVTRVATTPAFHELAAQRTGPATTPDQVATEVEVTSDGPGSITVTATDGDAQQARALAAATGGALISAVAERSADGVATSTAPLRAQLADLEDQLARPNAGPSVAQRYDTLVRAVADVESAPRPFLVPGPAPVPVEVAPTPVRNAALAFLAAVVLLAVAIPLVRAARGRLDESDPATWVRERLNVPAVVLRPGAGTSMVLAELYRDHLADLPSVTVVQLSRPHACAIGAELAKAAQLVGDRREHHDADGGVPEPAEPWLRTHRIDEVDELLVRALRGTGPTVLAVQTATARRDELERTVSGLRAIGAAPVAAVVWCGRIPRDPLHDPAAGDGTLTHSP